MMWRVILQALAAAGGAIWRVARSAGSTLIRGAIRAAKSAGRFFSRYGQKAAESCGRAWRAVRGRNIKFPSAKKLQKAFDKHGSDFGVSGNYSRANAAKLEKAIRDHVADSATKIIRGTYRRGMPVKHYVNPQTRLWVCKDAAGNFHTGWKLSPSQLRHLQRTGDVF